MTRLLQVAVVILQVMVISWTGPVLAGQACTSHDSMMEQLERRYAETPIAGGVDQSGKFLQVFTNKDRSGWTIVLTRPDGISCIVAAGKHWQAIEPEKEEGPQA